MRETINLQRVSAVVPYLAEQSICQDIPVETQYFAENENQDHAYENPRLLHVASHALAQLVSNQAIFSDIILRNIPCTYHISYNSDCVSRRETCQPNTKSGRQVQTPGEQAVGLGWRPHVSSDEDSNDEGVDGDDTRHDDGDERLRHAVSHAFSECPSRPSCPSALLFRYVPSARPSHTFMIRSDLNVPTPAIPMPDFAVPYAAPIPALPLAFPQIASFSFPSIHPKIICAQSELAFNPEVTSRNSGDILLMLYRPGRHRLAVAVLLTGTCYTYHAQEGRELGGEVVLHNGG